MEVTHMNTKQKLECKLASHDISIDEGVEHCSTEYSILYEEAMAIVHANDPKYTGIGKYYFQVIMDHFGFENGLDEYKSD